MDGNNDIEKIYNKYIDDMYLFALYLGFKKDIIMDAIHDVFCKLYSEEVSICQIKSIKHYLFASLKNRLLDICKSEKKHLCLCPEIEATYLISQLEKTAEEQLISIEDEKIINNLITDLLNKLTERQRQIVYLKYIRELEYKEIEKDMNLTYSSSRKLIHKALQVLRQKYSLRGIVGN
jgi:RNA polymerase sigma factor (sigma-70 family)